MYGKRSTASVVHGKRCPVLDLHGPENEFKFTMQFLEKSSNLKLRGICTHLEGQNFYLSYEIIEDFPWMAFFCNISQKWAHICSVLSKNLAI